MVEEDATKGHEVARQSVDDKKKEKAELSFNTPTKRERPEGRQRAKEDEKNNLHAEKRLEVTKKSLDLQIAHVEQMKMYNKIQLFTNGPRASDSAVSAEFFEIARADALEELREKMKNIEKK